MPKYRKKPIVFEAFQMTAELYWEGSEWPHWLLRARAMAAGTEGSVSQRGEDLVIHTLKGSMVIGDDDYIIQGAEGEIYPCKPDLFEATYEAVEGDG